MFSKSEGMNCLATAGSLFTSRYTLDEDFQYFVLDFLAKFLYLVKFLYLSELCSIQHASL